MTNLAILVGNTTYAAPTLPTLHCCHDDLLAVEALLKATEKYDAISIIENADADLLKTKLFHTLPGGLANFVLHVVPELQQRGLFREDYQGTTLREHLGLARPSN
jgi:hypothetical protein